MLMDKLPTLLKSVSDVKEIQEFVAKIFTKIMNAKQKNDIYKNLLIYLKEREFKFLMILD